MARIDLEVHMATTLLFLHFSGRLGIDYLALRSEGI